jgi:uncharacterized protein involved in outer membrane biogenesis
MDRSRRRGLYISLIVAACGLAIVFGVANWALNPESLKPRLVEAVRRATGRTLTISGHMGIALSLVPTISLEDVTLSNPDGSGFSRPDMVHIARVDISLGIVELLEHKIEISHVVLVQPDVMLETDPAGHRNWLFQREPTPAGEATRSPEAAPDLAELSPDNVQARNFAVSLRDVSVVDGKIGWIDGKSGQTLTAAIPGLSVGMPITGGVQATGTLLFLGQSIALTARTGRAEMEPAAWPVALRLETDGATITADGHIVRPMEGRGYSLSLDANVPDPAEFAALLPRLPLKLLKNLAVHAEVRDNGGRTPMLSALTVKVGAVDLDRFMKGTALREVTLHGRGKEPLQVSAGLTLDGSDSGISGTVGDLDWLVSGRSGPVTLDLGWNVSSARGSVKGTIQQPKKFAGFALDVGLDVPNPAQVLDDAPPALKSVVFQAHVTDTPGPLPFQLTSNAGDLSGELTVTRTPRLSVGGRILSHRLDLDMLALKPAVAPPPRENSGTAPPPAAAAEQNAPLIPDTKLPFGLLRAADADVIFALDSVHVGGSDIGGVTAGLAVKDGVLKLDPFTAIAPDQHFSASLLVDAAATPPSVHLTLDAPSLALAPVLAAFGLPAAATGTLEARADLSGSGDSPRALAATLDGRAGLAIQGGTLDARLVNSWLERLRPLRIDGTDSTDLRCLALRADAKAGVVTVAPFALDTAALILEGSGDLDLTNETLGLRLRPRAKIGGTGIALPLRISGPMRDPSAGVDISSSGLGGKGLAGLLLGGKDIMGAAGGGDPCPDALSRARDGGTGFSLVAPVGVAPVGRK